MNPRELKPVLIRDLTRRLSAALPRCLCRSFSFAPSGLVLVFGLDPRLTPWAAFFRRFAADGFSRAPDGALLFRKCGTP